MKLAFVSLFAGIGGIDLGLERAGMRCVAQVEIDDYCRRVLHRHWPWVPKFTDVRSFTRRDVYETVNVVAGGFPCQDVSNAGHKAGIEGARSGLWKEMLRIVRSLRPRYVLVENVAALRARGLGTVLGDLAASGFHAQWDCVPAVAVGAPHRRDRVFIVAHAKRLGCDPDLSIFGSRRPAQHRAWASAKDDRTLTVVGRSYRGYPARLRVDDGLPHRMERVHACGNAVVPQLAEWIGRRIVAFDQVIEQKRRSRSAGV
jgi:DNA (cytosine-5)-methyltransferase 1